MEAELLLSERHVLDEVSFVEIVVWKVLRPVPGSEHDLTYRLALIERRICVLRYDNETGKGDHRHWGEDETPYRFSDFQALLDDFWADVDRWRTIR